MMRLAMPILSLLAFLAPAAAAAPNDYAPGQVWEYRTRPGEEDSLLRIQSVEPAETAPGLGPIYHISVIGLHFANPSVPGILPHAPVSRETLDASVTRLSDRQASFPDPAEGIAEWRRARGGVFTISVAQIADMLDRQIARINAEPAQ